MSTERQELWFVVVLLHQCSFTNPKPIRQRESVLREPARALTWLLGPLGDVRGCSHAIKNHTNGERERSSPSSSWHLPQLDNWGITFALQFNMTPAFKSPFILPLWNDCRQPRTQTRWAAWRWVTVDDIRKGETLLWLWQSQCQEEASCPFHSRANNY